MSKELDNAIGMTENAAKLYEKLMQLIDPDEVSMKDALLATSAASVSLLLMSSSIQKASCRLKT